MSRVRIASQPWGVVQDTAGNVRAALTATITDLDGGAATVFAAETGGTATSPVTNAHGEIAGWIEEDSYLSDTGGGPVRVEAISGATIKVLREAPLNPLYTEFGAVGDDSTDDGPALQAMFDQIRDAPGDSGEAYIPPLTFKSLQALTLPHGNRLTIRGGGYGSCLHFPTDLGAGEYALQWAGTFVNNVYPTVESLRLLGPKAGSESTMGSKPADMHGLQLERKCTARDVFLEGFNANLCRKGSHTTAERVRSRDGYYNEYWETVAVGDPQDGDQYGDHRTVACDYNGARFASVAVGDRNGMVGLAVEGLHVGYAPYAFYRESGVTAGRFFSQAVFAGLNAEHLGNGAVFAEDMNTDYDVCRAVAMLSGATDIVLQGTEPSEPFDDTYKIAARANNFMMQIGGVEDSALWYVPWLAYPGAVGNVRAKRWQRNTWTATQTLLDQITARSRKVFTGFDSSSIFEKSTVTVGDTALAIGDPDGTFAAGDVIEVVPSAGASARIRQYSGTPSAIPVRGIAVEAGANTTGLERSLYATGGLVTANGSGITSGDRIRPARTPLGQVSVGVAGSNVATIASGSTSIVITHGLGGTPRAEELTVTATNNPTNDPGHIWISTITSTQFTVNCRADPGASGLSLAWRALSPDLIGHAVDDAASGTVLMRLTGR